MHISPMQIAKDKKVPYHLFMPQRSTQECSMEKSEREKT